MAVSGLTVAGQAQIAPVGAALRASLESCEDTAVPSTKWSLLCGYAPLVAEEWKRSLVWVP
jgi:hypothetical protein